LAFALLVLLGVQSTLEGVVSRLFGDDPPAEFPWVLVIVIYLGCMLVCVTLVALLQPLIADNDSGQE
jgi:hypothetical protein